jgi:PadR family transcriptional regulator PadR
MDMTQLLKGVLDVAVLAVVEEQDSYGYDVVRHLRARGLEEVGDASVYGTLRRLYAAGALTSYVLPSDEGPYRKYYGITPLGRSMLDTQRKEWHDFTGALSGLLGSAPRGAEIPSRRRPSGKNPSTRISAERLPSGMIPTGMNPTGMNPIDQHPLDQNPIDQNPIDQHPIDQNKVA